VAAAQLYGAAAGWNGDYDQLSWFPTVARFSLSNQGRTRLGDLPWTEAYEVGRRLGANQIAEEQLIDLRRQLEVGSAGLSLRDPLEIHRPIGAWELVRVTSRHCPRRADQLAHLAGR
jgi:hypothetical protein